MTALTNERMSNQESWQSHLFTLASGNKAWKNGVAAIDLTTGKVVPASATLNLFVVGKFAETVDATAGDKAVNVRLQHEIWVEWLSNDSSSVTAADVGSLCFVKDDQTVSMTENGSSVAGRVWAVDSGRGVAVEFLDGGSGADGGGNLAGEKLLVVDPGPWVSNNISIASPVTSGVIYEIPATTGVSTVTMAGGPVDDGTVITFTADGVNNAHTVQYKDPGGAALTAALTASKKHVVQLYRLNGVWRALAFVGP